MWVYVWVSAGTYGGPKRPDIGYLGTGINWLSWAAGHGYWELNLSPWQEQDILLIAGPSLQGSPTMSFIYSAIVFVYDLHTPSCTSRLLITPHRISSIHKLLLYFMVWRIMIKKTSAHAQDKCGLPSISNPQVTESMNAEFTDREGHLYMGKDI